MDPDNAHVLRGWPFVRATPLHVGIAFGSVSSLVASLQQDDAELEVRNVEGNTPLLLALRESHQDMALLLLDWSIERQRREMAADLKVARIESHGQRRDYLAHINAKNGDDETPLNVAMTVKAGEAIFKLIEAGADLDVFNHQIELVFYAVRHRDRRLLSMLIQKHVKLDGAVFLAVKASSRGDSHDIGEQRIAISDLQLRARGAVNCRIFREGKSLPHYVVLSGRLYVPLDKGSRRPGYSVGSFVSACHRRRHDLRCSTNKELRYTGWESSLLANASL
jgi:hypothetical protein